MEQACSMIKRQFGTSLEISDKGMGAFPSKKSITIWDEFLSRCGLVRHPSREALMRFLDSPSVASHHTMGCGLQRRAA